MPGTQVTLSMEQALDLASAALSGCGCDEAGAAALAPAMVEAEAEGLSGVGLAHLLDYCDGLLAGRINGRARPRLSRPRPAVLRVDGDRGVPHLGFERGLDELVDLAREHGLALYLSHNAFTCAGLGHFTGRLAGRGLAALAATNGGPALLAGSGTADAVFCTNPFSFAVPAQGGPPLVVDQSSSAAAYVNIREAARDGRAIPAGWALDARGNPTTDPAAALAGTLLPAGGARGGNLALVVELLAAGLCGAEWSIDAASAFEGARSPGTGLLVIAIEPRLSGDDVPSRIGAHLRRLAADHGLYLPGQRRSRAARAARAAGVAVDAEVHAALVRHASRAKG